MFTKEKIATLCLIAGLFFNPFGYDFALLGAMKLTGGYWNAISLFYCLLALFLGLYIYSRKNLFLVMGMFINPFGYDILFAWVIHLTGKFWIANLIFYFIAFIFFIVYAFLNKINPLLVIKDGFKNYSNKLKSLLV